MSEVPPNNKKKIRQPVEKNRQKTRLVLRTDNEQAEGTQPH